jgi:phosphoribosylamine--glycine ligase
VTVVVAAEGYPGRPVTGDAVTGLEQSGRVPGAYVLQAGTALDAGGVLRSSGGRVLNVIGTGGNIGAARAAAYQAVGKIQMRGAWWRADIAAARRQPEMGQPEMGQPGREHRS